MSVVALSEPSGRRRSGVREDSQGVRRGDLDTTVEGGGDEGGVE